MYYRPKPVKLPKVHHTLFGPLGRKWLDLHGLEGRFKIAQGPEPLESSSPPEPKETSVRNKPSGNLNAPKPSRYTMEEVSPPNYDPSYHPSETYEGLTGPEDSMETVGGWPVHPIGQPSQQQAPPGVPQTGEDVPEFDLPVDWEPGKDEPGEFDQEIEEGVEEANEKVIDKALDDADKQLHDKMRIGESGENAIAAWVHDYLNTGYFQPNKFTSYRDFYTDAYDFLREALDDVATHYGINISMEQWMQMKRSVGAATQSMWEFYQTEKGNRPRPRGYGEEEEVTPEKRDAFEQEMENAELESEIDAYDRAHPELPDEEKPGEFDLDLDSELSPEELDELEGGSGNYEIGVTKSQAEVSNWFETASVPMPGDKEDEDSYISRVQNTVWKEFNQDPHMVELMNKYPHDVIGHLTKIVNNYASNIWQERRGQ